MPDQEKKKKGLTKHRRKGLGLKRHRKGHCDPKVAARSHHLNLAHLRGVSSFLYSPPPPWVPPGKSVE